MLIKPHQHHESGTTPAYAIPDDLPDPSAIIRFLRQRKRVEKRLTDEQVYAVAADLASMTALSAVEVLWLIATGQEIWTFV